MLDEVMGAIDRALIAEPPVSRRVSIPHLDCMLPMPSPRPSIGRALLPSLSS